MSYDYKSANRELQGRCRMSRKIANNTYLKRLDGKEGYVLAVLFHQTYILKFFPDGEIDIDTGGWNTVTTKARLNDYFPGRVWSESGHLFCSNGWQTVGFDFRCHVDAKGKLHGDRSAEETRAMIREERNERNRQRNERNRPRNRARYWIQKARSGGKCRKLTVETILQEENATVRVAKMRLYGIERFLCDCKPEVIDSREGYELVSVPIENRNQWGRLDQLRALKMNCSTTGALYINLVPPHLSDVPSALDWMFDCEDYLGTVTQQT